MTLKRDRSYLIKDVRLDGETFGVFYHPKDAPVFSASRAFSFVAVFDTLPLVPSGEIVSWVGVKLDGQKPIGSDIWVYVKSSEDEASLSGAAWSGPYMNSLVDWEDITAQKKKNIVVRVLVFCRSETLDSIDPPVIDRLSVKAVILGTEGKFYTKTFDLGFIPRHILLTYNGSHTANQLANFSIAGAETTNQYEYQEIVPNKIVKIDKIPELASKLKLMVRAVGTSGAPFNIDCFAFVFGGEQNDKIELNQT